MIINNLTLILFPLVATGLNVGLAPNLEKLCKLTRFTHSSMFTLFTVIFSYMEFFAKSNFKLSFNNVILDGISFYKISLVIAVLLISINIILINQIEKRPIRVISSFIMLSLAIVLSIGIIFHESIFN